MTASSDIAVAMRGITKRFPGVLALDDVTLEVGRGELHAICGENGAGKSTLMKILAGAIKADGGEIHIDGRKVTITGFGTFETRSRDICCTSSRRTTCRHCSFNACNKRTDHITRNCVTNRCCSFYTRYTDGYINDTCIAETCL